MITRIATSVLLLWRQCSRGGNVLVAAGFNNHRQYANELRDWSLFMEEGGTNNKGGGVIGINKLLEGGLTEFFKVNGGGGIKK